MERLGKELNQTMFSFFSLFNLPLYCPDLAGTKHAKQYKPHPERKQKVPDAFGAHMNDLEIYFKNNKDRLIHKWNHYFDVYDRHFHRYRNRNVVIVEIGVFQGGSLQMWKNYFGQEAKIYGVDLNPNCKRLEEANIQIYIGSQSDRQFLQELAAKLPPIDILIDDGGHKMDEQIITFEELFDKIKPDGVYLCEDLHTSYRIGYGGGVKRRGTFIEYSKNFIDYINAWHSEQSSLQVTNFTRTAHSLHFYNSILVIEKGVVEKPFDTKTGNQSFENVPVNRQGIEVVKHSIVLMINNVLRWFRWKSFIWGRARH
jgi:hypothetical protein